MEKVSLFLSTSTEGSDPRFQKILGSCFSEPKVLDAVPLNASYWSASSLGLDRVSVFTRLGAVEKEMILRRVGEEFMRESCFIEMAGMSYTARMSLESNNLSERLFYSIMASEEATHFQKLRAYVNDSVLAKGPDEFTALVGEMISSADREQVIFLIQVLLEGWGLTHYSWLASNCQHPALRDVFKSILKDEARHHAAGTALSRRAVDRGDKRVVHWLETILSTVAAGPTRLVQAVEDVAGTSSKRTDMLREMGADATTREKLLRLRNLLENNVANNVLARFEEKNLFEPSL